MEALLQGRYYEIQEALEDELIPVVYCHVGMLYYQLKLMRDRFPNAIERETRPNPRGIEYTGDIDLSSVNGFVYARILFHDKAG